MKKNKKKPTILDLSSELSTLKMELIYQGNLLASFGEAFRAYLLFTETTDGFMEYLDTLTKNEEKELKDKIKKESSEDSEKTTENEK